MIVIVFDLVLHNSLQMTAPQPLNHHASSGAFSCISCHKESGPLVVRTLQFARGATRGPPGTFV